MPVHSAHNFSQQDLLLITTDPVQYMEKVQGMTDPLRNSCLAPFLRTCLAEHWPLMLDAGIIKLVEEASNCQGSISMIHALDAYTSCLRFMLYSEDEDADAKNKSTADAIVASRKISLHAWGVLKEMPDGPARAEAFRSAIQRVLEHLSLFGDRDRDISDPEVSRITLGDLLHSSHWHSLALHAWLSAPNSKSRRDSDATRVRLCDADTGGGYPGQVELYVTETPLTRLLSQLNFIIKYQDATEVTLAFCLDLLLRVWEVHHNSPVTLWDGFEADLSQLMWTIMRFGKNGTRAVAAARASRLLNIALMMAPSPLCILQNIVENHNGARLMARVAVLEAKEYTSKRLFMVDHVLDMLGTEEPPPSEERQDLISITRDMLEPVWLQTNLHLRLLESEREPQAKVVLKKWHSLGTAVNVRALINPLVGCSWFMCPLYEEASAKKMMLCKNCHETQYCSVRCQRGDWKAGHKERCKLVKA